MLACYMDDSADKGRQTVFSVAGFIADSEQWFDAERYWRQRVNRDGVSYFRAFDCKNLTGEFNNLVDKYGLTTARVIADALYNDVKQIVATSNLYGFSLGVLMDDYRTVAAESDGQIVLDEDPYVFAHQLFIGCVLDDVCRFPVKKIVAFVYDEHSKAALLQTAWAGYKESNPTWGELAGTLAPADDKQTPAVQIADLLANHTTMTFLERQRDPDAAKRIIKNWLKDHLISCVYADAPFLRAVVAGNVERFRVKGAKHGLVPILSS